MQMSRIETKAAWVLIAEIRIICKQKQTCPPMLNSRGGRVEGL